MIIEVTSDEKMQIFGRRLGSLLVGRTVIELIGDVGAGKTTLVKGIAKGMAIDEAVQSPTFTISRQYAAHGGLYLAHYDFYRLHEAGIMNDELSEVLADPHMVTIVEWGGIVEGVLPEDRLSITISAVSEDTRRLEILARGSGSKYILEQLG